MTILLRSGSAQTGGIMSRDKSNDHSFQLLKKNDLKPNSIQGGLQDAFHKGDIFRTDGTNVIRVPFGIRHPQKKRPDRPENWATLVLPLQPQNNPTPPPQAA